jgi:hypothetical protein
MFFSLLLERKKPSVINKRNYIFQSRVQKKEAPHWGSSIRRHSAPAYRDSKLEFLRVGWGIRMTMS